MFEVNDIVLHNKTDLCRVHEIRPMEYFGEYKNYYVLKPIPEDTQSNTILYVPVSANESRIRRMFSKDELRAMLTDDTHSVKWLESPLLRKKEYTELLNRGNPTELIGLIRMLSAHRSKLLGIGRKLSEADEKYLIIAEKKLCPLFHHVLGSEWENFLHNITNA